VLGTSAFIVLPPGERGLGAAAGRIVSYVRGDSSSTIFIRSFEDGSLLRTIETPMIVRDGLVVGARLMWSGVLVDGGALLDAGTVGVDLATADAATVQIAEPLTDLKQFGEGGIGDYGEWVVSSSGETAVTWLGGGSAVLGYVIDVRSFAVRATFVDAAPYAVTEDAVMLAASDKLSLRDISTGEPLWTIDSPRYGPTEYISKPILRDGEFVLGFDRDADTYVIAAIDVAAGAMRDVVVQTRAGGGEVLYVSPALSAGDALVLLPDLYFTLGDSGEVSASVLNPDTGEIAKDAFTIGVGG
jgi:hypothetical protein